MVERSAAAREVDEMGRVVEVEVPDLPNSVADTVAECPALEELLTSLRAADAAAARATSLLARLHGSGEVEAATGLSPEVWVGQVGRRPRSDRRMLGRAATTLSSMPRLAAAFGGGVVSWGQVRAIVLAVRSLPDRLRTVVDHALPLDDLSEDPDVLVGLVDVAVAEQLDVAATERNLQEAERERFLAIQPELDGSGGRFWGELDGTGLAALERATDPGPATERARDGVGESGDDDLVESNRDTLGRRRADRLVDICARALGFEDAASTRAVTAAGHDGAADVDLDGRASAGPPGAGRRPLLPVAPTMLVTVGLETLLAEARAGGRWLTALTGGSLKVSSAAARRIADAGGALRMVVLDDVGQIVGVGRKTKAPPGWLAEAILARDPVCREPGGCRAPARTADLDHGLEWDAEQGPTDVANLVPLCRTGHGAKTRQGWQITPTGDGGRIWRHARSGLTITVPPGSRRLKLAWTDPDPPPARRSTRRRSRARPRAPDPPGSRPPAVPVTPLIARPTISPTGRYHHPDLRAAPPVPF